MARKIVLLVAALIVPGGMIALVCAWLGRALVQSERGRRAISFAQKQVPAWISGWTAPSARPRAAA